MPISLRQIRYFIAVAENGSISGAAQQLGVSQSTVTESVKALEADLGTRLLQRLSKGVALTHKGHQFLRYAHKILASVADAERAIATDLNTQGGELNLGVTGLVAGYFLADLLFRYRRNFPNVRVRVVEDSREYIEHLLVNGELDLGVLIVSNLANHMALESEVLVTSPYRLWLSATHPLLDQDDIALADVAREDLIVLSVDELEQSVGANWREAKLRPTVVFRTSSVEAVRGLVATGNGVAILPDMCYRPWSLEGDRVEARELVDGLPSLAVGLAWRRGAPIAETAASFLEIAREHRSARHR